MKHAVVRACSRVVYIGFWNSDIENKFDLVFILAYYIPYKPFIYRAQFLGSARIFFISFEDIFENII